MTSNFICAMKKCFEYNSEKYYFKYSIWKSECFEKLIFDEYIKTIIVFCLFRDEVYFHN